MAPSCWTLGCGILLAPPAALLALLLAEPPTPGPSPGPREGEALPLRPGGRLPVLNLSAGGGAKTIQRAIYLRREAGEGIPTEDIFGLVAFPLPAVPPGHVRVRVRYISIDPGPLRGMLGHSGAERGQVDLHDPGAVWKLLPHFVGCEVVGTVEVSSTEELPVGTIVRTGLSMTDVSHVPASQVQPLAHYHQPASLALGVLGVTGRTAFFGMEILSPKPGETLFVTAAAGATGSVAGQLGKIAGCRVIGSAGTAAKVKYLVDVLGFDAAFNYREEDPSEALARLAPQGIDIFFENTGGPVSEAVLRRMKDGGRVAVSGLIHWYHTRRVLGALRTLFPSSAQDALKALASPKDMFEAFWARILGMQMVVWHSLIGHCDRSMVRKHVSVGKATFTVEHFLVICFDALDDGKRRQSAEATLAGYIQDGKLRGDESILQASLEDVPRAAINLWSGGNTGKRLVELVS